ncbi:MAG: bifunctional adenosylcobinamide kinase/adenosylcobinamide-phosphate guanylyltransferase [Desulfobacteraceae bacterium]|nr:bifunctional adenosylcobinamide kinase/adenosylcobinamide-phosphate guanylyltransferase [Desulfobacteraceae bacterium]
MQNTNTITLVIGGCRSGKSRYALDKSNKIQGSKKVFIATSVPTDPEMDQRVVKHQKERGNTWTTAEEPLKIYDIINQYSPIADVILVDCLTLWVSNLLFQNKHNQDLAYVETALDRLESALISCNCPVFLVSNEVGCGIVPENQLARSFRDVAGMVNQRVAKRADKVVMTVAGIDVLIKPKP